MNTEKCYKMIIGAVTIIKNVLEMLLVGAITAAIIKFLML
jgi:hypothetical protein